MTITEFGSLPKIIFPSLDKRGRIWLLACVEVEVVPVVVPEVDPVLVELPVAIDVSCARRG